MMGKNIAGTMQHDTCAVACVAPGPATGFLNTGQTIASPARMAALRMRAMDETRIGVHELSGSNGTVVASGDMPNALQTGIADGDMNPRAIPILFGQTVAMKYLTNATATATAANRAWVETRISELEKLRKAGVEVTELIPDTWATFKALSALLYNTTPMPQGAFAAWQAAIGAKDRCAPRF